MEKRIKTLYLITIVAILAFLGMQVYWLYGRYEVSLNEQEDRIFTVVRTEMDDYFQKNPKKQWNDRYLTSYTLSSKKDSLVVIGYTAEIRWFDRVDYARFLENDSMESKGGKAGRERFWTDSPPIIRKTYDASNAPSEGDVWTAMRKVDIEFSLPMSCLRLDSIMASIGVKGESRIFTTDSMIWNYSLTRHSSLLNPKAAVGIPYSELERKRAEVIFSIPVGDVLNDMWGTLAVAVFLSCVLIVCLVFQINTVLKLSRLDRMRNDFVTTMIHELKRPISTLKMCVSGIENDRMMEDKEMKRTLMSEARNSLDSLSAYFSKLRDITFNNVEQIPLTIQVVNLHNLFDEVSAAITLPAGKSVELINDMDPDLEVSVDQTHFANILGNLVENAVKYSGAYVEIKAVTAVNNGIVELRISDTGNGIPSGDLKHIFKRFYRGKAGSGEQPGIGLGLAYVRLLVEAHGGDVAVVSREGVGTCFIIKLQQ